MKSTLFTIGYATKEIDAFVHLLKKHGITCLIDVRTSPFLKLFLFLMTCYAFLPMLKMKPEVKVIILVKNI